MFRKIRPVLVLVVAGSMAFQAFSEDKARRAIKGWGELIDPDGDCKVEPENDKLTISIPPIKHDLSVEVGDVNAPRILRRIEGDFIAQVKVAGNVRHNGKRTSDRYLAYHGAGLLLWQDDGTYLRLERAAIVDQEGAVVHYANLDLRKDRQPSDNQAAEIPDQDTYLRLERRGRRVIGSTSEDGVHWVPFNAWTIDFGKEFQLGVDAINTSTEGFKAVFSEFEVFKKEIAR